MSDIVTIEVKNLAKDISLPIHATELSAGVDLYANLENKQSIIIKAGCRVIVPTGICIALPKGYEAQVRPRSGHAAKHGVTVLNSPGTIDADYRGEIKVILINLSEEEFVITHGMKIAQMVVAQYSKILWKQINELQNTHRGDGGFGSTGQ